MSVRKHIALALGALVLAGLLFFAVHRSPLKVGGGDAAPADTSTSPIAETATNSGNSKGKVKVDSPELDYGYALSASSTKPDSAVNEPHPSLNRSVVIPASFSPEEAVLIQDRIKKLTDAILQNPSNGALWANLGMERKGIEDYEGSVEAYAYALKIMPNNAVVAENLGVLSGDYLKDYGKAEEYYRLAIAIDANAPHRYLRLFDLYRYALKDTGKAKAILEEGLRTIPGEPSLQALLGEFQ